MTQGSSSPLGGVLTLAEHGCSSPPFPPRPLLLPHCCEEACDNVVVDMPNHKLYCVRPNDAARILIKAEQILHKAFVGTLSNRIAPL